MQPPGPSTTGVNDARLNRARGWGAWNFAPSLPRPTPAPPETDETEPEAIRSLAKAAKALSQEGRVVTHEERQQQRAVRRQYLSEPVTIALGVQITAAGAVSTASAQQTGPALITHVSMATDVDVAAAVLTSGAFLLVSPDNLPAGSVSANLPGNIPLWDLGTTIDRNTVAPGTAGGSLWYMPRVLIPWATFRVNLILQVNAAITRNATALVVYQRVSPEFREPDLDLIIPRTRRPKAPTPPDVHGLTRVVPQNVLVKGPGFQRQVALESLDPGLRQAFLEAWAQSKPFPGIIPL